ncbi:hypothetical protein MPRM_26960 [Mycobacterium parmense]|uniref:HTH hxlR-type domain-containing protein n=1 Tax=Mycobacterium parmense TaxID=185642 RepID=A0A7I7YU72_9MYCO|nr:hypothetical protein MPRM_26960 [Mycobacterium parmense]
MRYSELSRLIAGVSPKMLKQTLRSLERDGLITRTATPTVPVTVCYELTDLGLCAKRCAASSPGLRCTWTTYSLTAQHTTATGWPRGRWGAEEAS